MLQKSCGSYPVSIFMAGDVVAARKYCRQYCDEHPLCVTVTEAVYIYTGGEEAGFIVGLINYPRFPTPPENIEATAFALGKELLGYLGQQSFSIQTPEITTFFSIRPADLFKEASNGNA